MSVEYVNELVCLLSVNSTDKFTLIMSKSLLDGAKRVSRAFVKTTNTSTFYLTRTVIVRVGLTLKMYMITSFLHVRDSVLVWWNWQNSSFLLFFPSIWPKILRLSSSLERLTTNTAAFQIFHCSFIFMILYSL